MLLLLLLLLLLRLPLHSLACSTAGLQSADLQGGACSTSTSTSTSKSRITCSAAASHNTSSRARGFWALAACRGARLHHPEVEPLPQPLTLRWVPRSLGLKP